MPKSGFVQISELVQSVITNLVDPKVNILYHYTSAEGLKGIVENKQIWASHIDFLNDRSEFRLAFSLALDILDGKKYGFSFTGLPNDFPDILRSRLEPIGTLATPMIYISSLSEVGDLLSQWRAYCPSGGYSIGFDRSRLDDIGKASKVALGRVLYNIDESTNLLGDFFFHATPGIKSLLDEGRTPDQAAILVSMAVLELAPFIKHPSFSEEREWRLIFSAGGSIPEEPKFRNAGSILLPYVEVPLGDKKNHPFEEIMIGPNERQPLAMVATRKLIEKQFEKGLKVNLSQIPYRPSR